MYSVNDTILYGSQGVCRITNITEREFAGQKASYYVLKPIYDSKSTIFVPISNEVLTNKMRRVLSDEEIYSLIKAMPKEDYIWIDDDNARKERYKEIIACGNRRELVQLIKTLYQHQQFQKEKGKKLHISDERYLKEAQKLLYDEFALVLNIKRDQVLPFIMEQVEIEGRH